MKAILVQPEGSLLLGEAPLPQLGPEEIRIKVAAAGLNRADLLQRTGQYPPPAGVSPILGLEVAGWVESCGVEVTRWQVGERVCALLPGGGYAEYATIHQDLALALPPELSFHAGAAIPEGFLTAFQALVWLGNLQPQERVLIHAGGSGVGVAAIQLAKKLGASIAITASASKHQRCAALGAELCIDYQQDDFALAIQGWTDHAGVNVVLDCIGGPYFERNVQALALDGRLVLLALMGGATLPALSLAPMLRKRLTLRGSTLRNRPLAYKIELTRTFAQWAWSDFATGLLQPVVAAVFPWQEVASAHTMMAENRNTGKIILQVE